MIITLFRIDVLISIFSTFFLVFLFLLPFACRHFILALIFLDLTLLMCTFLFLFFTIITTNQVGYTYALFILGIGACDTAIGLGLFILVSKMTYKTDLYSL